MQFEAGQIVVADDGNHYPYHGQTIEVVRVRVTDREALDSSEMGLEILAVVHRLYPAQFTLTKATLLANAATMRALGAGEDPRDIAKGWAAEREGFARQRAAALLY